MAIPRFEEDLAIISKLGDNPGSDNNLTTDAFRAKFDEGPLKIQNYLNNVLIPAAEQSSSPQEGLSMQGGINMNGQKLNGLNAPMAEDEAANMGYVKRAYPHNLLDNSDFRNPVNQRGKTSYSGQGYGIDRWRSWNGENITTVNSGSVSCTKQLYQCVDPQKLKPDTRYTLAARLADGIVYCVSGQLGEKTENEKLHMEFTVETPAVWLSGGSWLWAALYEGEYTAETLPEYRPKGYGAELAECQRYFFKSTESFIEGTSYRNDGGQYFTTYCLPVTMRINPSIAWEKYDDAHASVSNTVSGRNYIYMFNPSSPWAIKYFTASADL